MFRFTLRSGLMHCSNSVFHSITSSATVSRAGGMSSPSALAVEWGYIMIVLRSRQEHGPPDAPSLPSSVPYVLGITLNRSESF